MSTERDMRANHPAKPPRLAADETERRARAVARSHERIRRVELLALISGSGSDRMPAGGEVADLLLRLIAGILVIPFP